MIALSEAAKIVQGQLYGEDDVFSAVKSDSREIAYGDLFVAIPGENFDGHQYITKAGELGAVGALVTNCDETGISQIQVDNTTLALARLATNWRERFDCPIVAITGSNGKTTVTRMVASILSQGGNCLSPQKSFNNQWGVPLTLLRLRAEHTHAAIEMGTNHVGEIDYLTSMAKPDVALINNVSAAHSEGLGDVDRIARAKAEIFNGLKCGGTAILNHDDSFYSFWQDYVYNRVDRPKLISFGETADADVTVSEVNVGWQQSHFVLDLMGQTLEVQLPLAGRHNARNAAAAAAIALSVGIPTEDIRLGLKSVEPVPGRLNIKKGINGSVVVDDSYNANPASIKSAVSMLADFQGKTILVLGEMAELGEDAEQMHREVGEFARRQGIGQLFCLQSNDSRLAQCYAEGYGFEAVVFNNVEDMTSSVIERLDSGVAALVKGSRSSQMEKVVEKITIKHAQLSPEDDS